MKRLQKELSRLVRPETQDTIYGITGCRTTAGKRLEVPGRDGFIYVRLRDNENEFVQAFNASTQNVYYGVPVILKRRNNRYEIIGRDTQRYSQWNTQDPSDGGGTNTTQVSTLLRHGTTHSFDPTNKFGGGDVSWIYSRQFIPGLVSPYNNSSPNVYIGAAVIKNKDNEWKYTGNTGTQNLIQYAPASGTSMVLVMLDTISGNPTILVTSGTYIPPGLTGTSQYLEYMPEVPNPDYLPLTLVRMETGTTKIDWDNLTDVREFVGGGRALTINGAGAYSNINFPDFAVFTSGSNAFVEYSGGGGGSSAADESILFSNEGRLATGTNVSNLYMFTKPATINRLYMYVGTLGVTGSTIADVNLIRSGTTQTIFATQGNRPTLQYNDTDGWVYGTPDITSFGEGDVLSLDLDGVAQQSSDIVIAKMITGSTSGGSAGVTVEEADGTPSVDNVTRIKFGGYSSVSDDGGGIVTVTTEVDYIQLQDQKIQGTGGGTFTAGAWQTRDLNTEVTDDGGHASLSSNQITLAAGTYIISATCPVFDVGRHRAKLYNVTDAADMIFGSNGYASQTNNGSSVSRISGKFTLASAKVLEIRHKCALTRTSIGFGVESNLAVEIYTDVELWKVA